MAFPVAQFHLGVRMNQTVHFNKSNNQRTPGDLPALLVSYKEPHFFSSAIHLFYESKPETFPLISVKKLFFGQPQAVAYWLLCLTFELDQWIVLWLLFCSLESGCHYWLTLPWTISNPSPSLAWLLIPKSTPLVLLVLNSSDMDRSRPTL